MLYESFQKLRGNIELNATFSDVVSRKHNAVRSVIENSGGAVGTKLIGSFQRKTRIQPRDGDDFDIDILVELGEFTRWAIPGEDITPEMAMDRLNSVVQESARYSAMNPQQDHPTVFFEYADGVKVELVAAYRDNIGHSPSGITHTPIGRGYWVPKNGVWELADYDYEASYISQRNINSDGWLIPTIKMLKVIKRNFFPGMKSFHLEILAADIIPAMVANRKLQNFPVDFPSLITDFFNLAENQLSEPTRIQGSNSPHIYIDDAVRPNVVAAIATIKSYCNGITGTDRQKIDAWREIFKELLPLS